MKRIIVSLPAFILLLPTIIFAQRNGDDLSNGTSPLLANDGGALNTSFASIISFIDAVIIPFILAIGFLVFVWGIFQYFILGGANDEAKESGKSLIMYAIAGFVIILAFWGIVNIISSGLNLEDGNTEITPPSAAVNPG